MPTNQKVVEDPETGEVKLATRKAPPAMDPVFRRLERTVPRKDFITAGSADEDERLQKLSAMLSDPAFRRWTLPKIAKECGLTYAEVLRAITKFRIDQGILKMSKHVPQVMEDTAIDAKSRIVVCPACKGAKVKIKRKKEVPCQTCDATGYLRKMGDFDSRKLLFEAVGLTGRNRGTSLNVNINNPAPMERSVDQVHSALTVQAHNAPDND